MESKDGTTDKNGTPGEAQGRYRVYVLRLWKSASGVAREDGVRCSLEDPTTRARRGFANLDALIRFIRGDIASPLEAPASDGRSSSSECTGRAAFPASGTVESESR